MRIPSSIPLGVRLDFLGLGGQFVGAAREDDDAIKNDGRKRGIDAAGCLQRGCLDGLGGGFGIRGGRRILGRVAQGQLFLLIGGDARGRHELDTGVRVGDGGEFEELIDAGAALLVTAFKFDGDAAAGGVISRVEEPRIARSGTKRLVLLRREILGLGIEGDLGAVGLGVHRQFDVLGGLLRAGAGVNHHGLAGGDQAVHAGRGDANALLAAGHFQAVELGPEEEPAEDVLDLSAGDARAVVDDGDLR